MARITTAVYRPDSVQHVPINDYTYLSTSAAYATASTLNIDDIRRAYETLDWQYEPMPSVIIEHYPCPFCHLYFTSIADKKDHINEKHF